MDNVFEVKDPMNTYVTLTEKTWNEHIACDFGHPEMREHIEEIKDAIIDPDFIFESHDSNPPLDMRFLYVKNVEEGTYTLSTKRQWCTKVVSTAGGNRAEVITAFPAPVQKDHVQGTKGEPIYEASRNG